MEVDVGNMKDELRDKLYLISNISIVVNEYIIEEICKKKR